MKFTLGSDLRCDLQKLIDTRALIQANSGGGKSHTLRRLLEQTHGHVQQLVIDPEGEFASLRERYDYVLAARNGGDTAADPRAAKLLAERLLELGVSAILDIYELKAHERIRFVRSFLEALVDAPKTLWHPALVVVDEAHVFCPQQGEAESAGAVIDLCTRGRKRGFSAILATQRLSKLHKDAAAELNNKLIGRTGLDVDRKRAGEELGFTTKEQLLSLRQLEPGHFYAFGPALSLEVQEVRVGPVETTHPKAGSRIAFTPPPPTEKVKALLPQLADLPAEAEQKAKSEADLRKELATARAAITRLEHAAPARVETKTETKIERVEVPIFTTEHFEALSHVVTNIRTILQDSASLAAQLVDARGDLGKAIDRITGAIASAGATERAAAARVQTAAKPAPRGRLLEIEARYTPARERHNAIARERFKQPESDGATDGVHLKPGARRVLAELARWHGIRRLQPDDLATRAMVSNGGTFTSYLSTLRTAGFLSDLDVDGYTATPAGLAAAGPVGPPDFADELLDQYRRGLKPGAQRVLDVLRRIYPDAIARDRLAAEADVSNGGTFTSYLSTMRTRGIVVDDGKAVKLNPALFWADA